MNAADLVSRRPVPDDGDDGHASCDSLSAEYSFDFSLLRNESGNRTKAEVQQWGRRSSAFLCLPAQAAAMQCTSFIPEAQAVLDLVDQCPEQVQKGRFPIIVIEGLDATGKTTVTQSVSDSLKAVLLKSPPSCISQWRKIFDDEPNIIRRAFYSLGNYIVASEIAEESTTSPVIVDRYWHSTATYAIATEVSGGLQHLPPAHHPIYQWPRDLLKPDLVLLLTVSPEERMQRLEGRGMERTREEAELETNNIFRQKVEVSYQRMENPGCHVVDASASREEVLQMVLRIIRNHCSAL
ncbi:UMP-CMP kinase 2, mitochondrial [Camelus ferus]|nr:UMP-CMP kinase 2, mitochondrial [Camelus ferus]